MALLLTQPKTEKTQAPDWTAIQVPDDVKSSVATTLTPAEADKHTIDFARDIAPLLDRSCAACHGGDMRKGKFSIATRESILKGGQSGDPAIRPGNSEASKLLQMVSGQIEDLEMPPLAKRSKYPALTGDEVRLFKTWIDEGLPWDNTRPQP